MKVSIIEGWASDGVPANRVGKWPKTVTELAAWHEPEIGVLSWRKANIVSPQGPYPDLRARFDLAVRSLAAAQSLVSPQARLEQRLKAVTAERNVLAEQVVLVRAENVALSEELARERSKLRSAEASLRKLVSFPR